MNDICRYTLQLRGQVAASEINAMSPIQLSVVQGGMESTCLTFSTDQSGLVGLLSFLHRLGFVFLSLNRVENLRDDKL
jgi:hypothetical protein